jgi:hypothetical protein
MAIALLLLAVPHSGIAHPRTGPAASDIALFVMAAAGLWFAQRQLKRRKRKAPPHQD